MNRPNNRNHYQSNSTFRDFEPKGRREGTSGHERKPALLAYNLWAGRITGFVYSKLKRYEYGLG